MHPCCRDPLLRRALPLLTVLLMLPTLAASALAAPAALRWSGKGFSRNGNAIEHLTIRGSDGKGRETFLRFSFANAAYRDGGLEITAKFETAAGKFYAKKTYPRGKYTVDGGRLGLRAGGNVIVTDGNTMKISLALGDIRGEGTLQLRGPPAHAASGGKGGLIERDLLTAWGALRVGIGHRDGRGADVQATVFAVHEASTVAAHRIYDRSVQLHRVAPGRVALVDYIVMPAERGAKPLGFVAIRGGKTQFVGLVGQERRSAEHRDGRTGYQVPWGVEVHASQGGHAATVKLAATRQAGRKDDLAKLPYLARKAVGLLFKPYTFTLDGSYEGVMAGQPDAVQGRSRWRYAQTR